MWADEERHAVSDCWVVGASIIIPLYIPKYELNEDRLFVMLAHTHTYAQYRQLGIPLQWKVETKSCRRDVVEIHSESDTKHPASYIYTRLIV